MRNFLATLMFTVALFTSTFAEAESVAANSTADKARIISIGGAVTELVCALGSCEKIVAVDTSSEFPESLKAVPKIGYSRSLSTEGIIALKPTLVLLDDDAGPPHVIQKLKDLKVPMVKVSSGHTVADAKKRMKQVAEALGEKLKGEQLTADFDAGLAKLSKYQGEKEKKRILFIYARGGKTLMVAGEDTAVGTLIGLMGGENAIKGIEGFKPLTAEAVAAAKPDIILMTESGAESLGGAKGVFELPGLKMTPAALKKNLLLDSDLRLLTIGPRTAQVIEELHARLAAEKG